MPVARRSAILFVVNNATIRQVAEELGAELTGGRFGRVFLLGKSRLAIDFRLRDGRFLLINTDPRSPGLYLIRRKMRELEKASTQENSFTADLRKNLSGAEVVSVLKLETDRVVLINLQGLSDLEGPMAATLAIQLTGRSSNVFRLDEKQRVVVSLKPGNGDGQIPGQEYRPPEMPSGIDDGKPFDPGTFDSLSEALDAYFVELEERQRVEAAFKASESRIISKLKRLRRLSKALAGDLESHGDPERWKTLGDLLLANASNALRDGDAFIVTDYFAEGTPEIRIEADPRHTPSEAAERYFRKYSKARNAREVIAKRMEEVRNETAETESEVEDLRDAFERGDYGAFITADAKKNDRPSERRRKKGMPDQEPGIRKFFSSDGFEILVGKKSKDNDRLTFRIAGSLDTWLHAADYPGSHVVIRNPARKEIPPSTLKDAAMLAAFYSKARGESKAAVHYTLRKFVHKPKGAKPGLVSLADFKTLMVEPGVPPQPS